MSVRITEISANRLGPIDGELIFKPRLINLVYGKNERGKTCLVEFLIRSLFRNAKEWGLRDFKGVGRVLVEGLSDKAQAFSPSAGKKVEDFWEVDNVGLPSDFSRLLVVKGAEPDFSRAGVDKTAIARFLSGMGLLDRILNPKVIKKTIQSAYVENGTILGNDKGEINDRNEIGKKLKWIDVLFDQIDKGYSGGLLQKLLNESKAIEAELETMSKAKRYLAFLISEEMKVLEKEKGRINESAVEELDKKAFDYQQRLNEQKRRRVKQAEAEKRSSHYMWLKNAREQYSGMLNERRMGTGMAWQATAAALILVSIAGMLAGYLIPALFLVAAALVCGAVYLFQTSKAIRTAGQSKELDMLRREFEARFGGEPPTLSRIGEMLTKVESDYYESVSLKGQIADSEKNLESLKGEIINGFKILTGKVVEPDAWNEVLEKAKNRLKSLTDEITDKRLENAKLHVDEGRYEKKDPCTGYDEGRERELEEKKKQIDGEMADVHRRLGDLKQRICNETNDDHSITWPELIEHLKSKRAEVSKNYRDKTAEILAKIAVVGVAETLRKDENAKIEAGLNAPEVKNLLKSITGRYDRFLLEGETIHVSDPYQEFNLSDLSTGAREQVLLALRIGFASMLSKRDKLFLVFDDAFQYSDWDRRGGLVETATSLAGQGWQIFYFTMDDQLRDLFDAKGKEFGKEYMRLEL